MEEKLGQVNEPVWNTIKRNTTLLAMRLVLVLLGIRGAGIHLYHHPHFGIDHFAVTHHMRWLGWFRTYSIFVPDRSGGSDFEFVFTANCNGTFEDFCRYVHLFDDVVLSLNYSVP